MTYLVSDFHPAETHVYRRDYWRVTGAFNSLVLAKQWAGADSIITEHDDAEAFAIHKAKVLPDDFAGRRIAA